MTTANRKPMLGIIVPPAAGKVPPELPQLYGEELSFISQGLGVPDMSNEAFDRVVDGLAGVSRSLAASGAQAIALMGTSLSFYRGKKFNDELTNTLRQAGGIPATTMSTAIVAALHAVGAKRLAVGTAYTDDMNRRLTVFLSEEGFEVLGLEALDILSVEQTHSVGQETLLNLGRRAASKARDADALLISCGGLRTLHVDGVLERDLGVPVVSSSVAGAWGAARLVGHSGRKQGYGRLLAGPSS